MKKITRKAKEVLLVLATGSLFWAILLCAGVLSGAITK